MALMDRFRIKKSIGVLLSSPDTASTEYANALATLRHIGQAAIPSLIQALGKAHSSASLEELLATLLHNDSLSLFCNGLLAPSLLVVTRLAKVLAHCDSYDPNKLLDLFTDAKSPKGELVKILTAHKERLHPKSLLALLHVVDKDSRTALFRLIEQVATEQMIPELLLQLESDDYLARLHIARVLSCFQTAAVREALARRLTDSHKQVRLVALEGLATQPPPGDVGPICQLLRDPDMMVQSKAIEVIIRIDDQQAVHHLLDILQDESEYVRRAAVEVLNAVGNTNAIQDLLRVLKDKDWWVRVRAADALGSIGGPKVVEAVLPLIKDEDEFMRRCAVEILNTTKDERAVKYLMEALEDKDWWVQERAVDALANLGDKQAVPAFLRMLDQNTQAMPAAIRALASMGDQRAIRPLLARLQTSQKAVLNEILRALSILTDAEHAEVVQQAIAQAIPSFGEESKQLAESAIRAIAENFGKQRHGVAISPSSTHALACEQQSLLLGAEGQNSADSHSRHPANSDITVLEAPPPNTVTSHVFDPIELESGAIVADRYRVIQQVGKGAFGVVILVEDVVVNEEIILKFLNSHLASNEDVIKRFMQELRHTRKITHENVIRIYDFITLGKTYAISMEYFPSHPLASEIRRDAPMARPRALRVIRDICYGMAVAHHANIIHRDLKPQNLLLNDDGWVKIVDFGLSAATSHPDSRLTRTGIIVGTPTYMAPEQVRGGNVDARTDIYSLGIIMYEILTGRPPYTGQEPMSIMYQHVEGKATPPSIINPDIPSTLEAIVLKAMAVAPAQRYQSVNALREDLVSLVAQETE